MIKGHLNIKVFDCLKRERAREREREREITLSRIQLSFLSFILSLFHL